MGLTSVLAAREVAPRDVVEAVEAYLDGTGVAHTRSSDDGPGDSCVQVFGAYDGWTTVTWPAWFVPRDVAAGRSLSRDLHTVVSTVTATADEGWSHTLVGCGTVLDRFHSYPAALVWYGEDVAALAADWAGDFELVARVCGVDACGVRRHFCQATVDRPDHPGREREGYLALWSALGIRPHRGPAYAVLELDPAWQRLPA